MPFPAHISLNRNPCIPSLEAAPGSSTLSTKQPVHSAAVCPDGDPVKLRHPHLAGQGMLSYSCCFVSKIIPSRGPAAPGAVTPGRAWPQGQLAAEHTHAKPVIPLIPEACFPLLSINPAHLPACARPRKAHIQQDKFGVKWISVVPAQAEETK